MALGFSNIRFKFFELIPLFLLFFISLNGISVINIKFFTVNIHYILVYYWVLRQPHNLGYGFIFLAGIINDIMLGFPIGINALSLLVVAAVAAYVRVVTVRIQLINDWISFIPSLILKWEPSQNGGLFVALHPQKYNSSFFVDSNTRFVYKTPLESKMSSRQLLNI